MKIILTLCFMAFLSTCNNKEKEETAVKYKTTGSIERIDIALDALIDTSAKAEIRLERGACLG